MLESLEIKNYRNLKNLRIDSLGKVNLFTGKNNTGKSAVLEAVAIYASRGDMSLIYQLLEDRGENYSQADTKKNPTEANIRALSSLFTNRIVEFDSNALIYVGTIQNTLFNASSPSEKSVLMRFRKFYQVIEKSAIDFAPRIKMIEEQESAGREIAAIKVGFEIMSGTASEIFLLEQERFPYRTQLRKLDIEDNLQFIRTRNLDRKVNGKLFDNIALTEKEEYVINALKLIEPATERIAFVEEVRGARTAVIKLAGTQEILPLKSMGDGINRILSIILALVNSDNGFLLIDEFENGLHYAVQEQLWSIIYKLAQELNVQVFATTHSEDCIAAFASVLNGTVDSTDGKMIRLDNINGNITHVEYSAEELKIANEHNIETR